MAFAQHDIDFDLAHDFVTARYALDSAKRATHRLILDRQDLTALFCMSDVMAIGAIRALTDLGFSVPTDVSVVGYDGVPMASFYVPRITTICQDKDRLANRAVAILFDHIAGLREPVQEIVPFCLITGESVGPPRRSTDH
jgi:LacI family transcriptional regulator